MNQNNYLKYNHMNGDRFIGGGFLGPFILGGITGGLLAPAFNQRPYPYPYPVPVYGPVYPTGIVTTPYQNTTPYTIIYN